MLFHHPDHKPTPSKTGKPLAGLRDQESVTCIASMIKHGLEYREIATRLNCTNHVLNNVIYERNLSIYRTPMPALKVDQVRADLASGLTQVEIAAKYGCSRTAVSNLVQLHKIESGRSKSALSISDCPIVRKKVQLGLTQTQIATDFGVTQSVISRFMIKHGIEPNGYSVLSKAKAAQ